MIRGRKIDLYRRLSGIADGFSFRAIPPRAAYIAMSFRVLARNRWHSNWVNRGELKEGTIFQSVSGDEARYISAPCS